MSNSTIKNAVAAVIALSISATSTSAIANARQQNKSRHAGNHEQH